MKKVAKAKNAGSGKLVKTMTKEGKRPPKSSKGVANDLYSSGPRSAIMPRPTKDTKYSRRG